MSLRVVMPKREQTSCNFDRDCTRVTNAGGMSGWLRGARGGARVVCVLQYVLVHTCVLQPSVRPCVLTLGGFQDNRNDAVDC